MKCDLVVVGGGIVGITVTDWLEDNNIGYTWIVPNTADIYRKKDEVLCEIKKRTNRSSLSYSPKLQRHDYSWDQNYCKDYLGGCETNNFTLSRSVRVGGLANYWGGNTCKSFVVDKLCKDVSTRAKSYTLRAFETLSYKVLDEQEPDHSRSMEAKKYFEQALRTKGLKHKVYWSELAIYSEPYYGEDFIEYNSKMKGNVGKRKFDKAINGIVKGISRIDSEYRLEVDLIGEESTQLIRSRTILMCTGPVESLRLVHSICPEYNRKAVRIMHHPLVSGFLYMRGNIGQELSKWPLACFDIAVEGDMSNSDTGEWYANIIPVYSTLKAVAKKNRLAKILLGMPLSKRLVKNIMVVNIYLPAHMSASYIFASNGIGGSQLHLVGGHHPNLVLRKEKILKMMQKTFASQFMRGMFFRLLSPGTDQHLSSTVCSFCDQYGRLKEDEDSLGSGGVFFLGGASARSMPICNPSFYFTMRAIDIMEHLKRYEGLK